MPQETRVCQNCKHPFTIEPEDFAFYEKMSVPPPTWCPECRMIRRMMFRNERYLFRRKDNAGGKEIFSGFSPQAPVVVYEKEYWWGDGWDATAYARDYDFSRSFFEQIRELINAVPRPGQNVLYNINCDYGNNLGNSKNCYLCFNLDYGEDSAYLINAYYSKNCFDITSAFKGELNYDSILIDGCFQTFFSYACEACRNVWFSRNCVGCSDCFGCVNLRNKQYYIFNKPYTKEAYFEELKRMNLGSHAAITAMREQIREYWNTYPYKYMFGYRNKDVTGDWIANSKNVKSSFNVIGAEDSKYCQDLPQGGKDNYDYTLWGDTAEQIYESIVTGWGARNVKFSNECWPAPQDMEYCLYCSSSSNLFACAGLKKKSYCILNKQYSKEDYFALREKIIRHMNDLPYTDRKGCVYRYGEFFPPEFSPFAYNETIAQDFFPLTKDEAEAKGFLWRAPPARAYQTTLRANDLPDHIRETPDTILKEIIACASCGKAYRIIQMELDFLRTMSLPLPRMCPECRFAARTKYRNPPRFYTWQCRCAGDKSTDSVYANTTPHQHGPDHCPNEFETSYAPERPEIVYCEQCYQQEVV